MKILSLNGQIQEKPDKRDAAFAPRKTFARTALLMADGFHFFAQTADGQTDHTVIPVSELWAHVEKNCPNFCVPAPSAQTASPIPKK